MHDERGGSKVQSSAFTWKTWVWIQLTLSGWLCFSKPMGTNSNHESSPPTMTRLISELPKYPWMALAKDKERANNLRQL